MKRSKCKYALVWDNGKVCVGEDWVIAKHYLKVKKLEIGIIKVNKELLYSTRKWDKWIPRGTIRDTHDPKLNKRLALKDYFERFILTAQKGFKVVKLYFE